MNILRAIRQRVRAMARMEQLAMDILEGKIRMLYEGREKLRWSMQLPFDCPDSFLQAFPYRWGREGLMTREAYEALPEYAWERTSHATWQMFSRGGDAHRNLTLEQALTICRYVCRWNAPWESQIAWDLPRQDRVWWLLEPPSMYANIFVVSLNPGAEHQYVDWACLGYWELRYGEELPLLIEGWNAPLGATCN